MSDQRTLKQLSKEELNDLVDKMESRLDMPLGYYRSCDPILRGEA